MSRPGRRGLTKGKEGEVEKEVGSNELLSKSTRGSGYVEVAR